MSNMNLVLPTVSQTPGPQWASIINSDLTLIDQHDHTDNKGLPVPTAGLNINDELKFNNTTPNGLPATGLSYLGLLSPQSSPAPTRVFSDAAGDFYYRNAAGVDVQLTVGSSVAGTSGSIANLVPPASASYDIGAQAFIWRKDSNEGATMDSGPLRLRDGSAGSNAVTITPASGTSNYTLTLPIAAPGSQSILTVASSGISTFATVNSTLTLTSSLLKVADLGVSAAQLAVDAVETAKIKNLSVTTDKLSSPNLNGSGTNTSLFVYAGVTSPTLVTQLSSVQLSVSNIYRPVFVTLSSCGVPTPPTNGGAFVYSASQFFVHYRVTDPAGVHQVGNIRCDAGTYQPAIFQAYFFPSAAGIHTVDFYVDRSPLGGPAISVSFCSVQTLAYQL